MKVYYFVFLKSGPNTTSDSVETNEAFAGHMVNIKNTHKEGKLKLAGPLVKDREYRSILILNADSQEEINQL